MLIEVNGDDRLRGFPDDGRGNVGLDHIEPVDRIDKRVSVASNGGDNGLHQLLPEFRCDLNDHAVVDQHDPGIRLNENVPRMRIGMEETVDEELPAVKLNKILDHPPRVDIMT